MARTNEAPSRRKLEANGRIGANNYFPAMSTSRSGVGVGSGPGARCDQVTPTNQSLREGHAATRQAKSDDVGRVAEGPSAPALPCPALPCLARLLSRPDNRAYPASRGDRALAHLAAARHSDENHSNEISPPPLRCTHTLCDPPAPSPQQSRQRTPRPAPT